ncbi:Integral membrane protein OS=Streptomyces alboniger OX=132473 GN=CP975_14095 PE=4 SV=1 [Streptomyces alboniger]
MSRGGQGLARVAVVVRAGAAPMWWLGVFAAGIGVLVPGVTGRRIGVMAGAALFVVAVAVVAYHRRKRYIALARSAARAGKHDVLQDRAVSVRNWRRGHRWWLLLCFLAALGSAFAVPAAGGMLLAGCGTGLRLKAAWLGRRERAEDALLWVRVDWLAADGGRPAGKAVRAYRSTGVAAGDAAPGGARRRTAALV